MKWIGSPVAEIYGHSCILGAYGTPFWGKGRSQGVSEGTIRKSDGSFLYALHCDHCTICNHSAAICYRMSLTLKSTGGGSLWAQIWGCSTWSRPMMFGSAESEHPMLTNDEIILDVFQPMWSQSTNVTDRQTDRQHAIAIPRFALKCIAR